jgi:NAD(P)H-nitrite reductase large subunit
MVRDIGVFAKKKGWTIVFGGNSARRPRVGDIIAEDITKEELLSLTKHCLEYYGAHGKKKERTARFVERIGIDEIKNAVL